MITILGSSGYMGSQFVKECNQRGIQFYAASREKDHYDTFSGLANLLTETNPELVINCAAYIPVKSVDLCKDDPDTTIQANVILPEMLAYICGRRGTPLMHLSTGCLYNETKVWNETDTPTRGYAGYCGFYVGTKKLAEKIVEKCQKHYTLRIRVPFDETDNIRNYLSKLKAFPNVFRHTNSLSHRGDVVKASLDLWNLRAAFGTYNMVNPGFVTAEETCKMMLDAGIIPKMPNFSDSETTGCLLSTEKLMATGIKIRPIQEALRESVYNWKPA